MPKAASNPGHARAAAARFDPLSRLPEGQRIPSTVAAHNILNERPNESDRPGSMPPTQPNINANAITNANAATPAHRPTLPTAEANYLIMARIGHSESPNVWRLLSVPPSFTWAQMHDVLQRAFDWSNSHAYTFEVTTTEPPPEGDRFFFRSPKMHIVMYDEYFDPDRDSIGFHTVQDRDITLREVYEKPEFNGKAKVNYTYDLGDNWEHELALIGRAAPDQNAQMNAPDEISVLCLAGEGRPLPEHGRKPKEKDAYKWNILRVNDALMKAFCPEVFGSSLKSRGRTKQGMGKRRV
ncbi:hypothetical protein MMC10_003480 [Thelotrema lepadinum]|nr:hypothetical protein [Thelotrema lepadinum]